MTKLKVMLVMIFIRIHSFEKYIYENWISKTHFVVTIKFITFEYVFVENINFICKTKYC